MGKLRPRWGVAACPGRPPLSPSPCRAGQPRLWRVQVAAGWRTAQRRRRRSTLPPRAAARPVGLIAAPRRRAARRHPSRHPPVSGVTLYATSGALVSSRAALRANSDPRATSAPPATRITRWVWPDALVRFAPQERCCGQHGDDSDCAGCGAGV